MNRGNNCSRLWFGIPRDMPDAPIRTDEDHIKRNISVLHPHGDFLCFIEQKNHAVVRGKLAPEHKPLLSLWIAVCDLDLNCNRALHCFYFELRMFEQDFPL